MPVTATYDYAPADHVRAARAVARQSASRYVLWLFVLVPAALLVWTTVPLVRAGAWGEAVWGALPLLAVCAFWLVGLPLMQRRAARALPARDASLRGPQTRSVNEAGYHSRGNGVAVDLPWHAMARAVETPGEFLFFYNPQCAYYLPKRVLAADDVPAVRALARAGLGDRARLLGG